MTTRRTLRIRPFRISKTVAAIATPASYVRIPGSPLILANRSSIAPSAFRLRAMPSSPRATLSALLITRNPCLPTAIGDIFCIGSQQFHHRLVVVGFQRCREPTCECLDFCRRRPESCSLRPHPGPRSRDDLSASRFASLKDTCDLDISNVKHLPKQEGRSSGASLSISTRKATDRSESISAVCPARARDRLRALGARAQRTHCVPFSGLAAGRWQDE